MLKRSKKLHHRASHIRYGSTLAEPENVDFMHAHEVDAV